jgi:hypothetical protein
MCGAGFLARLMYELYSEQTSMDRRTGRSASEGLLLSVSTRTDQIGETRAALVPIFHLFEGANSLPSVPPR